MVNLVATHAMVIAVQMLWLNIVTKGLQDVALAFDRKPVLRKMIFLEFLSPAIVKTN